MWRKQRPLSKCAWHYYDIALQARAKQRMHASIRISRTAPVASKHVVGATARPKPRRDIYAYFLIAKPQPWFDAWSLRRYCIPPTSLATTFQCHYRIINRDGLMMIFPGRDAQWNGSALWARFIYWPIISFMPRRPPEAAHTRAFSRSELNTAGRVVDGDNIFNKVVSRYASASWCAE